MSIFVIGVSYWATLALSGAAVGLLAAIASRARLPIAQALCPAAASAR
jgi:hypothetical protein